MNLPTFRALPRLSRPMVRELIPMGIVMIISIGIAVTTWLGLLVRAETKFQEKDAAFQAAKQQQARLQSSRTVQEHIKAAREKIENEQRKLPTRNEFSRFAMAIAEMAQREHVAVPGMTFTMQKKEPGVPVKATIAFHATGGYASIFRFIQRLEGTESYLVIESLDAARVDRGERQAGALVQFNMKVATFLRVDDETKGTW